MLPHVGAGYQERRTTRAGLSGVRVPSESLYRSDVRVPGYPLARGAVGGRMPPSSLVGRSFSG